MQNRSLLGRGAGAQNQFESRVKFLCLKGKGRTILFSCIRNALMLIAVATQSHKTVIFQPPHAVDANCDDSVMSKVPKPGCGLESVALKIFSRAYARISCTPLCQILDPPLHGCNCRLEFVANLWCHAHFSKTSLT